MKQIKFLMLLILFVGIQACKDSSNPIPVDSNFIYPLNVGNSWSYNSSVVFSNFRPDSIRNWFVNIYSNAQVVVTGTKLLDTIQVYEMKEMIPDLPSGFAYYANTGEGLIKYAYKNGGNVLPKTNSSNRFYFKGNYYNSVTELIKNQEDKFNLTKKYTDSLVLIDPPRMIYAYPLKIGTEWIFSPSVLLIKKVVIGKVNLNVNNNSYECYKIQLMYAGLDILYYEYVSSKGLLRIEIIMKDIPVTSISNPDGIGGKIDITSDYIISGINF